MTEPQYPAAPAPAPGPAASAPGRTLGIVAIFVAIFFNVIGLILGIVALVQSRRAGVKNGPAIAAIVIGAVITALWIIGIILAVSIGAAAVNDLMQQCADLGPGTHMINGVEYTCR